MDSGDAPSKLRPRQEAFLREYFLCGNASEAMRKAGYKSKNPNVDASRLLATPGIRARIEAHQAEIKERFEITESRILQELAAVGFGNLSEIVDGDGDIIDESKARYLSGISRSESESSGAEGSSSSKSFSISTHNKVKALELLGRHIGMWSKNESNGSSDSGSREALVDRVLGALRDRNKRGRAA